MLLSRASRPHCVHSALVLLQVVRIAPFSSPSGFRRKSAIASRRLRRHAAKPCRVWSAVSSSLSRRTGPQAARPPGDPRAPARARGEFAPARHAGLWAFGSVARGEAWTDSDIDLVAEFDPTARVSLTGLASLRADLADFAGLRNVVAH
jgi:hypothetical protein